MEEKNTALKGIELIADGNSCRKFLKPSEECGLKYKDEETAQNVRNGAEGWHVTWK